MPISRNARSLIAGLIIAGAGAAAACASGGNGNTAMDRNVITAEEAATVSGTTAWDVVSQLRPEFLRGRGVGRNSRPVLPVVYLDNVRLGGASYLRNIPANSIETIGFISAADATTRWGTGHTGGALDVRTRDGSRHPESGVMLARPAVLSSSAAVSVSRLARRASAS